MEFKELITHFEKAASRKDGIAHGIVMLETVSGEDGKLIQPAGWMLLIPDYKTSRTFALAQDRSDVFWDRGKYRYNSTDIYVFERKFTALTEWAFDYATRIGRAIAAAGSHPS